MNNMKNCIKMSGIILVFFVFSLYSHFNMRVSNAADNSVSFGNTMWRIDCGMYKICGNAKIGFSRNYECNDCLDCFCPKSQNPIDSINLAQNDLLNKCLDYSTALNELESVSMLFSDYRS